MAADVLEDILLEVDDPAVRALLPRYLARRQDDMQTMREALSAQRFDEIALLAHRMRGSGAAYGMPKVTQFGRTLEHAAQAADVDATRIGLDELAAYLGRVRVTR